MARVKMDAKLKRFLRNLKKAKGVGKIEVGFWSSSKYPDGTPVTNVAAWNEFGTKNIHERPFFRNALEGADKELIDILVQDVDPKTMVVDRKTASKLGESLKARVQRSITTLRNPPNAPSTIRRKGSSNPLVDTKVMGSSVTYRIDD